ncbi:hypothetical protein WJX84_003475 [Apatococcus fuscideae]|uniref:Uncharacterized protein n=1 Tax=Apatococcus fuscideae TaxID=2026836 RepID=A0AAW1SXE9_9CHLO
MSATTGSHEQPKPAQHKTPQVHSTHSGRLEPCTSLADFSLGVVLGHGSFGRVTLGKHKATKTVCAIKALSKAQIIKNQQVAHLRAERDILKIVDCHFIVKLLGFFHDDHCVYFVLQCVNGGEFFRHLRARGRLTEEHARFYAAEVLLAFQYFHSKEIVYRDLKPENILLDNKGHIKMTDLGFCKIVPAAKRTYTLCGTPDYLAPEIILNKGHGKAVDWWAYGVLLYELMAGYPPFFDSDVTNTYKKILGGRFTFPPHFSISSRDLIRKLLVADLSKRYGCLASGVDDIKNHPWFKGTDWGAAEALVHEPPIKPTVKSPDDTTNFDDYSSLPPILHDHVLSKTEQAMFTGF